MRSQKLYAGVELRETRRAHALTQAAFAERLGISLSYLNQMENNHRPLSAAVVLALAERFQFDLTRLSVGESDRIVADMREALADPVFAGAAPPLADLQLAAANAPALARAFLTLHRAWRQSGERLASIDAALGREDTTLSPLPWEEVRDFFHYCDNYIDAVDIAAEGFAAQAGLGGRLGRDRLASLSAWLGEKKGISVALSASGPLRSFDGRTVTLSA
ncbi:MAG: transcriptional regulator with XRE-family HTH domain, partial [Paracoccaceae bacterium]